MGEMARLVAVLATTLSLTMVIEVGLAVALGVRGWRELLVVALAQVVTNPSVELVCLLVGWSPHLPLTATAWPCLLSAELMAWLAEALLYGYAHVWHRPWVLSAILNLASFGFGILLGLL